MIDENKLIKELRYLADEEFRKAKEAADLGEDCFEYSYGEYCYVNAIDTVKAQPTKTVNWVPCSERLPEKNGMYLVTRKDGVVAFATYDISYQSYHYWYDRFLRQYITVIA